MGEDGERGGCGFFGFSICVFGCCFGSSAEKTLTRVDAKESAIHGRV